MDNVVLRRHRSTNVCHEYHTSFLWLLKNWNYRAAGAKLNNFTKLEPILHLLGVNFDTNVARDVMSEKHGAATRLMYQLFIALHNKEKSNLTGTAIETMRPAGPVKLENITSGIYKEVRNTHQLCRGSVLH